MPGASSDWRCVLHVQALLQADRWMLGARRIADATWILRRQGQGHFVVSSAGHEAIGAAAGNYLIAHCSARHSIPEVG